MSKISDYIILFEQKIALIEKEEDFKKKAKKIYKSTYQKKVEADEASKRKIAATEVDSGDYFIDDIMLQAEFKGRENYPHKQFFFFRVAAKAVYSPKGVVFNRSELK